jgi:hypothetical protein
MSLPNLHIIHPREQRLPGITAWIAEVERLIKDYADWDDCQIRRAEYTEQAGFDVPTQVDIVRRAPGPVILIQNVQARIRQRFESFLRGRVVVYCFSIYGAEDLWQAMEVARKEYEDGEPRIPLREIIAYLILRKLERQGKWGGTSLNKAFLWSEDLPKGGFPKDLVERRAVFDVASELERHGILQTKKSSGQKKYALGPKAVVQPILDAKAFENRPKLREFFERDGIRQPSRLLNYNDQPTAGPPLSEATESAAESDEPAGSSG